MPQNPTRQVHALLGGFVQDTLIENQNRRHKTDKIIARTLFFSKNQNYDLPKRLLKILTLFLPNYLLKKDKLTLTKTTAEARKYFMLTETLAEKGRLLLLPKLLQRKDKPILEALQNQPRTKPKPRNKANQNHCKPKRKLKTLKPILATRQNQREITPTNKTPPNEKAETLKTCLLKKY